jgi:hypothetical protein
MRAVRIALPIACVASALCATPALAATRYAAPGKSDAAACTQAAPCSLKHAVEGAGDNNDVVVEPGRYIESDSIFTPNDIYVHGVLGQPRPVVATGADFQLVSAQSRLSDIEFRSTSSSFHDVQVSGTSVERVVVISTPPPGSSATACRFDGPVVLRDVVCFVKSDVGGPTAIDTGDTASDRTTTLRNVTAVQLGPAAGRAVLATAHGTATHTLNVANSIVRGSPMDFANVASGSGHVTGSISHSNSATTGGLTDGGGNQTVLPLFVDLPNGNLHEGTGAPTIDAGLNSAANGIADADGVWRTVHGNVDIGGYEHTLAPTATTGGATAPTLTGATVHGTVNPNGAATSYHFEYGKTTTYGNSTPGTAAGSSGDPQAATATVTGLKPGTTYHYRAVGVSALGTTHGADMTFKTAKDPFIGVVFNPKATRTLKSGKVSLAILCPGGTPGPCTGRLVYTIKRSGHRKVVGRSKRFSIKTGRERRVKAPLTKKAIALLDNGVLRAKVTATAHDAVGTTKKHTRRVRIRPISP